MIQENLKTQVANQALALFSKAGIVLTDKEIAHLEIADFGLNDILHTGLEIITYVNTKRCCAKELALLPHQTCPQHRHAPFEDYIGKEETFRVRYGTVYLYVAGSTTPDCKATPPAGVYTVFHEIILHPGEQYTLAPDTPHWFQAGPEGAVVSEFSTPSFDERDIFIDPAIQRVP